MIIIGLVEVRSSLEDIRRSELLSDSCEVCITGIPKSFSDDHSRAVQLVFDAANNGMNVGFVLAIRAWPSLRPASAGTAELVFATGSTSAAGEDTFSLMVKLISPNVRNSVIANSHLLRGRSSQSIFGAGGDRPVFMRPLWPQPTYELLRQATAMAKALNYLNPVVRNLIVYMRKDRVTPPPYSNFFIR